MRNIIKSSESDDGFIDLHMKSPKEAWNQIPHMKEMGLVSKTSTGPCQVTIKGWDFVKPWYIRWWYSVALQIKAIIITSIIGVAVGVGSTLILQKLSSPSEATPETTNAPIVESTPPN